MPEIVYGYMNRCSCGNLFLPTGRDRCNPCHRKAKLEKYAVLATKRQARREAKAKAISERRKRKLAGKSNKRKYGALPPRAVVNSGRAPGFQS